MRCWLAWWCLVLCFNATAGEAWTLQVTNADPVVRHGLLWRCRIVGEVPPSRFDDGPYLLQISLTQGDNTLVTQEHPLARLGQLVTGFDVVLVPGPPPMPDQTVELAVTVSDPQRRDLQHLTRALPTPIGLQRELERRQRLLQQRSDHDPLPALWLEQAGEVMLDGPSLATCRQLVVIGEQLDRWLAGERTPTPLRAWRDPIDDSVQPYRLYPVNGTPVAVVLLLADPQQVPRKSAWPAVPEAWLAAARSAGCLVVQLYPGGDPSWTGAALRRTNLLLDRLATLVPAAESVPLAVVGSGRAAAGAVALAEAHPLRVRSLGVIDGRLPTPSPQSNTSASRWMALHQPGERPAHLLTTAILVGGERDAAISAWIGRLRASKHPVLIDARDPTHADFWRALTQPPMPTVNREWVVLGPGKYGDVLIEEVSEWGVDGSLLRSDDHTIRTAGIARLRLTDITTVTVDGRPYRAPPAPVPPPRKALGQATGPLAAYADGPFSVVVGTGESEAWKADNEALAKSFVIAWANHAHARLRPLKDTEVLDDGPAGRHLVLIGNARSNLLLARLMPRLGLPVEWDARTLRVASKEYLRADRRPFALCWPHPAKDGRLLVILDGRPAWNSSGFPLAGLPDLLIGGLKPEDPPTVERLFGNDWR